jgi:hypothetical protein
MRQADPMQRSTFAGEHCPCAREAIC